MSNSIYDIQNDLLEIFDELENNDGLLTEELALKLDIAQDSFKNKIKSYCEYIKHLESDLTEIKIEKQRLDNLKKVKERTIENLKNIMAYAINNFGEVTKSGTHFVDFGTGKVSTRKTESVDINEELTDTFVDRVLKYFNWLKFTNTFDVEEITPSSIRNYANLCQALDSEENQPKLNFSEEDVKHINSEIKLNLNLNDLISTQEGHDLMKAIVSYTDNIEMKPSISKTNIKDYIKEQGVEPEFATLVVKDSVTIK